MEGRTYTIQTRKAIFVTNMGTRKSRQLLQITTVTWAMATWPAILNSYILLSSCAGKKMSHTDFQLALFQVDAGSGWA